MPYLCMGCRPTTPVYHCYTRALSFKTYMSQGPMDTWPDLGIASTVHPQGLIPLLLLCLPPPPPHHQAFSLSLFWVVVRFRRSLLRRVLVGGGLKCLTAELIVMAANFAVVAGGGLGLVRDDDEEAVLWI